MKIQVIPEHSLIILDGIPVRCNYTIDSNIYAINWSSGKGVIQYIDETPNELITSASGYGYLLPIYWEAYGEKFKPTRFHTFDIDTKQWFITVENQAILDAEAAASAEKLNRQQNSTLAQYSFEQIKTYIDSMIPPTGQTADINIVVNRLAEFVKAIS